MWTRFFSYLLASHCRVITTQGRSGVQSSTLCAKCSNSTLDAKCRSLPAIGRGEDPSVQGRGMVPSPTLFAKCITSCYMGVKSNSLSRPTKSQLSTILQLYASLPLSNLMLALNARAFIGNRMGKSKAVKLKGSCEKGMM